MKFKLPKFMFNLFSRFFVREHPALYQYKRRPRRYSKNAWSYIAQNKATLASALYAHIGAL